MKYLIFTLLSLPLFAQVSPGGGDLNEEEAYAQARKGSTAGGVASGGEAPEINRGWKSRPQTGADERVKGGAQGDSGAGYVPFIPERHRMRRERK